MSKPPIIEHAVSIDVGGGVQLSGMAVVPDRVGSRAGVLLLSGSGPLDRDSNMNGQRLAVSSTLAAALASAGVASLRFDKRGVAASSGDYASTGFDAETADAVSAFETLRAFEGIDPDRVGVMGHSVGATISARLAAGTGGVAFAVLLACAAVTGAEVMAWQTDRIAAGLPGPSWTLGRLFRRNQARNIQKLAESTTDVVRIGRKDEPARWMREYRAYDPRTDLVNVSCPILAITGDKDIQVDPDELVEIESMVRGPCTTLAPANLTHVLRNSPHKPSITRYSKLIRKPVEPSLVQMITDWVTAVTAASGPI